MEIKSTFDHMNINVTDLERSLAFYDKALGLKEVKRKATKADLEQNEKNRADEAEARLKELLEEF